MKSPGDELIIRLWDTLAEKGVGGLLRPWQERRVGNAQAEVRAREVVLLAQAQSDAARIAASRDRIIGDTKLISIDYPKFMMST